MYFQLGSHARFYNASQIPDNEVHESEAPTISRSVAIVTLLTTTVLIAINAEFLVSSLDEIVQKWGISEQFIGIIILPIVGNAAEHVTAVYAALRDKMDLAIGVALGSSIQISLFVTPLLIIVGWIINQKLTLIFSIIDIAVLFLSILVVNHIVSDGESNCNKN